MELDKAGGAPAVIALFFLDHFSLMVFFFFSKRYLVVHYLVIVKTMPASLSYFAVCSECSGFILQCVLLFKVCIKCHEGILPWLWLTVAASSQTGHVYQVAGPAKAIHCSWRAADKGSVVNIQNFDCICGSTGFSPAGLYWLREWRALLISQLCSVWICSAWFIFGTVPQCCRQCPSTGTSCLWGLQELLKFGDFLCPQAAAVVMLRR